MVISDKVATYSNHTEVKLSLYDYDSFRNKETGLNVLLNTLAEIVDIGADGKTLTFPDYDGKLDFVLRTHFPLVRDDMMCEALSKAKEDSGNV